MQLERLHKLADFVAGKLAVVFGKKIENALSAFFSDEVSLFEKECLAGKVAGMLLMTSTASGVRRGKAALFQWVQVPPGDRSSRKQPEQSWR